jgi:WD40 repeat protein
VNAHRLWYSFALLLLAPALGALAADKDANGDPLPEGAVARLGSARMFVRNSSVFPILGPDYTTALIPDSTGVFRRVALATGQPVGEFKLPEGARLLAVSSDGSRVVAQGQTAPPGQPLPKVISPVAYDAKTGKVVAELKTLENFIYAPNLVLSGDGKVAATPVLTKDRKREVAVVDTNTGQELARIALPFPANDGIGLLLALSPDGGMVAVYRAAGGFEQSLVHVFDVESGQEVFKARITGTALVTAIAFSPKDVLAVAPGDGSIDLWDTKTGKRLHTLLGRWAQGRQLAFSPDGSKLAGVATDGVVQWWSVADGKALGAADPPAPTDMMGVQGIGFAGADKLVAWGAYFAAGSANGVAWDVSTRKFLTPIGPHTQAVKGIGFSADSKTIITGASDSRAVHWDAQTGQPRKTFELRLSRNYPVYGEGFVSPDGTRGMWQHAVYDLTTGEQQYMLPGLPQGSYVAVDRANLRVVLAPAPDQKLPNNKPKTAVAWNLATRTRVGELGELNLNTLTSVALSADGTRAALVGQALAPQGEVIVIGWDLKAGKKLSEVSIPKTFGALSAIAFTGPDTAVVLVANRIVEVDLVRGEASEPIEHPGAPASYTVAPVAISPDGKTLAATAFKDRSYGVTIYDWTTKKPRHTVFGHHAPITAMTFSPDGKTLATGSVDTTVLLWDLAKLPAPK